MSIRVAPRVIRILVPGIKVISRDFLVSGVRKKKGRKEMYRTLMCNDIRDEHIGRTVSLAGWVDYIRDHSGVIFLDLRDYTGVTQVVIHDESLLEGVTRESVISVSGIVEKRDPDTVNEKIDTGFVELAASELQLLGRSKHMMPFEVRSSRACMRELKGAGNPAVIKEMLEKNL